MIKKDETQDGIWKIVNEGNKSRICKWFNHTGDSNLYEGEILFYCNRCHLYKRTIPIGER